MADSQASAVSYIPTCSQQTHLSEYNNADAAAYHPQQGSYYAHKVPTMLPGAIIGAICLVAALAYLLWVRKAVTAFKRTVSPGPALFHQV